MIPLTAAGAEAGAVASPFCSRVARGPGVSGTPAPAAEPQSAGGAAVPADGAAVPADGAAVPADGAAVPADGAGTTPPASRFPAPAAGGRSTRTGPDHSPLLYGMPIRPA